MVNTVTDRAAHAAWALRLAGLLAAHRSARAAAVQAAAAACVCVCVAAALLCSPALLRPRSRANP